jgi:uncharacterized protein
MLVSILIFFLQSELFAAVDCGNADLAVEKMICHSTRAEKSDREMSFAYRQALKRGVSPDLLRSTQRKWEDEIRNRCNTVDCLVEANSDRAYEINSM